jgi:cytochrome c
MSSVPACCETRLVLPSKGASVKIDLSFRPLALAAALALAAGAAHAQTAAAGAAVFAQCDVCHSTDGSASIGPTLKGVVGRKSGTVPGFDYSKAMKAAARTWDAKALEAFIADPQAALPDNLMPFSGISDAKDRANLIAYLATQK